MLADDVYAWLCQQPSWQRDLARRLATQVELDDTEYDDALKMVKAAFGVLPDGDTPSIRPIERDQVVPAASDDRQRILALGGLQGVGLLNESEELTFGRAGLTLIYGQNAVGKSSYVRALKVLCRTVDRDCKIRGNVYETGPGGAAPSARIRIEADGDEIERRTTLDSEAVVSLAGISVFDTACAELYVNAQNSVQYIPPELRLLARLGTLQDRMRRDLANERDVLQRLEPSRAAYPVTTEVGRALAGLQGTDQDSDLASLAVVTEEQESRAAELRALTAVAAAATGREVALAARREAGEARALGDALLELARRVNATAAEHLRQAAAEYASAEEAVNLAAEEFDGPVPGIGGQPWQLMWDAARTFVEDGGGQFPPGAGAHCPLCLQPLTETAAARLGHFRDHVESYVQSRAATAAAVLANAKEACAPTHAAACRAPIIAVLQERAPDLARNIESLIETAGSVLASMGREPPTAVGADLGVEAVLTALNAWADAQSQRADAVLAADDPEKLRQAQAELAELDARARLTSELEVFTTWRARLRTITALTEARSELATNRITSAQRTFTESEISKALNEALVHELRRLSCTHVPVELNTRTQVAETRVGLRLLANEPAGVCEIVSDGERRALALAFFFAELEVTNQAGGIVVDDPVSSLDDDRRAYIAARLVAEADERQVIVFTHDLPFVFDLRSQAKLRDVPIHFQHVWRQDDDVGRVDDQPPFKAMGLRERIGRLEQELGRMKSDPPVDHDQAWQRASGFYQRLRRSWERAVEERLFGGVIERFERDVKTLQLKYVTVTDVRIAQVEQGMTRASAVLHEEAFAAPAALPSLAEMAEDLESLRAFERDTRPTG